MVIMTKEKFEEVIRKCREKYSDRYISDTTKNIDPDGYMKQRTVVWYYRPYTFTARYLFGAKTASQLFVPLGFIAKLDGDTEEEKLKTTEDLAGKILKANLMREAEIV